MHGGDGGALQRRQQHAAERIAEGEPETALERLFALALLSFWRLNQRSDCAACAAALERVSPEHAVLEQLRRERPDIVSRMQVPHVSPQRKFPPLDPQASILELSGLLAQQLQRDDLEGFARACQEAGEDVLPLAIGLDV
jgi:AcrR family transcriptional regulator